MSSTSILSGIYYGKYEKVVHLMVSGGMMVLFFIWFGVAWAAIVALAIGLTKELWDASKLDDHFDLFDMLANVAGIIIAGALILLIDPGRHV